MKFRETVWHSSRISEDNAEIDIFDTPQEIQTRPNYFSVMPASSRGFMTVMSYGEDLDNTWTAIANGRVFRGRIKEGDKFWVDGEKPNAELEQAYGHGATANAVVKNVSYANLTISITLTRNKEQVKQ